MVAKLTTAPKSASFSWNQREKWSKILQNLHSNQHLEKLITPCNGPPPPPVFPILYLPFPTQAYQTSQTQPPTYYQTYHYVTPDHPQPSPMPQITYHLPAPQITYPPPVSQITYPAKNNTNPQVKTEANPPLPPPLQIQEL
jgi:hypothetical protein